MASELHDFAVDLKTKDDNTCKMKLEQILEKNIIEQIKGYVYKGGNNVNSKRTEGENEEELQGHNLLHLAVCFGKTGTASLLSNSVPDLMTKGNLPDNRKDYLGLTPFHIAIAQGQLDLTKEMLEHIITDHQELLHGHYKHGESMTSNKKHHTGYLKRGTVDSIDQTKQDIDSDKTEQDIDFGKRTCGTVFMGQLPLTVAVLSYISQTKHSEDDVMKYITDTEDPGDNDLHLAIISELLRHEELILARNYLGETVFHSVMRFINCFPAKEGKAKLILKFLDIWMQKCEWRDRRRWLYFITNNDQQTALQLATEYAHTQLFRYLMEIRGVYRIVYPHDDVYEIQRFDVTEIDQITLRKRGRDARKHSSSNLLWKQVIEFSKRQSITELICSRRSLEAANAMITANVFDAVIRRKWSKYRSYYWFFFVFHLFNLVCLNVHIVAKGYEIVKREKESFAPSGFVAGWNIYFLVIGVIYILQELWRFFLAEQPLALRAVHHNVVFRLCLLLTGICLVVDSSLNLALIEKNNWFLVFAVITSTWFLMFFIRGCPYFSVYVVLINEALFKAVLPFAVLIFIQVFVFSSCMHSFFLELEPQALEDEDLKRTFDTYGKTALTMGKLMVGLTEVENLLNSNQDVLAIIVFTLFCLITFLLMVNALIGVMTNRFSDTQIQKVQVTYVQKLSIIVFFEGWFIGPLECCAKKTGINFDPSTSESERNSVMDQMHEDQSVHSVQELKDNRSTPDLGKMDQANGSVSAQDDCLRGRFVMSYRKIPSDQADEPSNIEHKLSGTQSILKEMHSDIKELLENGPNSTTNAFVKEVHREVERIPDYESHRKLHVYHYSKD